MLDLRIDHLGLTAQDPEASAAFYERVLGLERLAGRPPPGAVTLRGGGIELVLSPGGPEASPSRAPGDHFAFAAAPSALDGFATRLAREGIPHQRVDTRIYLRDPDGYVVEVDFGG